MVTFRASRRRREMYCGHARMCVCLSAAACLHYCRDPDVTWGSGRGCPLVVHYLADLQSVRWLPCCGNVMRTRNVSEYIACLYSLYAYSCMLAFALSTFWSEDKWTFYNVYFVVCCMYILLLCTVRVKLIMMVMMMSVSSVVFTARRYASAVLAVVVCPSVCLSVCHKPVLYRNGNT